MRSLNWCVALAIVMSAWACSGGGSLEPSPSEDPLDQVPTSPAVSAAVASLWSAAEPQGAFEAVTRELVALFESEPDPDVAAQIAIRSGLETLQTPGAMDRAVETSRLLGSLFSLDTALGSRAQLAQSLPALCPGVEARTVLYYVNGVANTADQACTTLLNLRAKLIAAYGIEAAGIDYRLYYNPSGLEDRSTFCRMTGVLGAVLFGTLWPMAGAYEPTARACGFAEDVAEAALQLAERAGKLDFTPEQVSGLRATIQQDVDSGRRVILVGHSQGNLFIQQALADIDRAYLQSVGVVAVAPPREDPSGASYGLYREFMLEHDILFWVEAETRLTNPLSNAFATVPALKRPAASLQIHEINGSYLRFPESWVPIRQAIIAAHRGLTNPAPPVGQGVLQASAVWSANGDMDLHVFEPTGAHVYFADPLGDVGQLDRDDTQFVGPENYFVCEPSDLVAGEYAIWINNYAGDAGTTAWVTVRAGPQVRQFQVNVGPANLSGTPVHHVATVSWSPGAGFSFR